MHGTYACTCGLAREVSEPVSRGFGRSQRHLRVLTRSVCRCGGTPFVRTRDSGRGQIDAERYDTSIRWIERRACWVFGGRCCCEAAATGIYDAGEEVSIARGRIGTNSNGCAVAADSLEA